MASKGVQEAVGKGESGAELAGRRLTLFHEAPFWPACPMNKTLSRNVLYHKATWNADVHKSVTKPHTNRHWVGTVPFAALIVVGFVHKLFTTGFMSPAACAGAWEQLYFVSRFFPTFAANFASKIPCPAAKLRTAERRSNSTAGKSRIDAVSRASVFPSLMVIIITQ